MELQEMYIKKMIELYYIWYYRNGEPEWRGISYWLIAFEEIIENSLVVVFL